MDADDRMVFRVSSAVVDEDGPFSDFSGYDRTLVNLGPGSMGLCHQGGDGSAINLLPLAITHFDGGVATHCLVIEPCRDFNIFCAKGAMFASVFVRQLQKPEFVPIQPTSGLLIYVLEGSLVAKDLTGREYFIEKDEALVREPSDTVNQERWMLAGASARTCLYVAIAFFPVRAPFCEP